MSRSQRRLEKEKRKKRCRKIYPWDRYGKFADNMAFCRCSNCINPRNYHKSLITLKEKINLINFKQQMKDNEL